MIKIILSIILGVASLLIGYFIYLIYWVVSLLIDIPTDGRIPIAIAILLFLIGTWYLSQRRLIAALLKIPHYIGGSSGDYDENLNHKGARRIGWLLALQGGQELLLKGHSIVAAKRGTIDARELESCWDDISSWRG